MKRKLCCALLAVLTMNRVGLADWKIWWTASGETGSPPTLNTDSNAAFSGKGEGSTVRVRWGRNDPNSMGAFVAYNSHNSVTVGAGGDIATTFTSADDNGD